jgi:hypothetical protein
MGRLLQLLEGLSDLVDVVTHPRFYAPVLCGIGVAAAAWHWMPAGDVRDVIALSAFLGGIVVGLIWDWGR